MQAAGLIGEGTVLTVYRAEDGKLWARPRSEFDDGRFEPLPPPPPIGDGDALREDAAATAAFTAFGELGPTRVRDITNGQKAAWRHVVRAALAASAPEAGPADAVREADVPTFSYEERSALTDAPLTPAELMLLGAATNDYDFERLCQGRGVHWTNTEVKRVLYLARKAALAASAPEARPPAARRQAYEAGRRAGLAEAHAPRPPTPEQLAAEEQARRDRLAKGIEQARAGLHPAQEG